MARRPARPVALTIAGSDPSGGAGIQADLRAFQSAGVWGASVVTLLTAQGTGGVRRVRLVSPRFVEAQIAALFEDLRVRAIKTGALGSAGIVRIVARRVANVRAPLVVDPVLRSTSGAVLLDPSGMRALRDRLLPRAALLTPNAQEAGRLTGTTVRDLDSALRAAELLRALGAEAVLVKGGHLPGPRARDVYLDGRGSLLLVAPRRRGIRLHGAGCVLSAMICASLARGIPTRRAVRIAHRWVRRAIARASPIGRGLIPLGDLAPMQDRTHRNR